LYEPYNPRVTLTVGDLLRIPELDLRLVAGESGTGGAIRWVHSTELSDPTPFLKGGELLLTTGIGVGKTAAQQRAFIERLARAGLAGLGLGLGFDFARTPKGLIAAADRAGFPVFEVPYPVPFIAITEAVSTRLGAEQYDLLSRSLDAEHTITRAVLDGHGVEGVVAALIRATGGWALLLDLHGVPVALAPASARAHAPAVWAAVQKHRGGGLRFALSLVDRGNHLAIQPVAAQGRVEAFLALGKREALTQFDRIVSSHALALLSIELSKARAVAEAERRMKGDLLDQLLSGAVGPAEARSNLERLGFDVHRTVAGVALAGDEPPDRLVLLCEEVLAQAGGPFLAGTKEDLTLAVIQPSGPGYLPGLREALAARANGVVQAGAGSPVALDDLVQGVREARYALQVCRTEGRLQAEFTDLGTYQLLLSLQEPAALRTFADSVLGPLDRYDEVHGGELIPSLRAFLDRNARWETAAGELFVHRHTLRYRMRKVEELTGRDLASARDRMEFFLAIRARELLASSDWPNASVNGAGQARPAARRRAARAR
jgi:purine catabolism regulator